ncbi:MAG: hypothetical protein ACI8WB_006164, partial [Phenylobacterium sp.]
NMNKIMIKGAVKGIVAGLLGLSMANAQATGTLVYENSQTTLTCVTPATCGTYTATDTVEVYKNGNEMRLYWSQNQPSGIADGTSSALTIGASCPLGSAVSNLTAQWDLWSNGRPSHATATHCDGVTVSEYNVTRIRDIDIIKPPRDM